MNKKKQAVLILCTCIMTGLFLCTGCGRQKDKTEADEAVMTFFSAYKRNSYRGIDRQLFSDGLKDLLNKATAREEKEVELVLNSDYPTDKPYILDFDVFTSMVEGADSLRILRTTIKADTAQIDVLFSNGSFDNIVEWEDQLIFVKKTGWVLDNVIYGADNMEFKSLQDLLEDYITGFD